MGEDKCDQFTTLLDNWHPTFAPDDANMMVGHSLPDLSSGWSRT